MAEMPPHLFVQRYPHYVQDASSTCICGEIRGSAVHNQPEDERVKEIRERHEESKRCIAFWKTQGVQAPSYVDDIDYLLISLLPVQPAASPPTGRIVELSQHGEPTRNQLDEIRARVADGYDAIFKQKDWSGVAHAMLSDLHFLLTFFKDATAAASTEAQDTDG